MMMVFGMFVFTLRTIPYQQLQHAQEWQYIGPGEDNITLSGVLYPEITGGNLSLSALETIGYSGRPWPLIEGDGRIYGMYVMTRLERGKTEFDQFGGAKKIEFTLSLSRADADFREKLQSSSISDALADLQSSATKAINATTNSLNRLF